MKYIFFIQSEGRGHLVQALALKSRLEERGHAVVAVITGKNHIGLPDFFVNSIKAPVFLIDSPNFVLDKDNKGIKTIASVIKSVERSPDFFRSLKKISAIMAELKPDAIISFYEPMAGIYVRVYRDKRPFFCIGHQYFISHPSFIFPKNHLPERRFFRFFNRLTAPRRSVKIALSFTDEKDQPDKNLFIVPPLLRREILKVAPKNENFLLIYLLNSGYQEQIEKWSAQHPEIKIEAFSTRQPKLTGAARIKPLVWHELSAEKFINRLASCQAYISTAGFDSIAEAAFLGKNIMMVPTKNHFEQLCNAVDAARAQLAIFSDNFDLDLIFNKKEKSFSPQALSAFRHWVDNNAGKIVTILERR